MGKCSINVLDMFSANKCLLFYFLILICDVHSTKDILKCPIEETIDVKIQHKFHNGTILTDNGLVFSETQYHTLIDPSGNNLTRACICQIRVCIPKCIGKPVPSNDTSIIMYAPIVPSSRMPGFRPKFFDGDKPLESDVDYWIIGRYLCETEVLSQLDPTTFKDEIHYLQRNGSLLFTGDFFFDGYCMNVVPGDENGTYTYMCEGKPNVIENVTDGLVALGALISVPFLIATFLVYGLIPELRNVHGKSLMCHVLALAVCYTFLVIIKTILDLPPAMCTFCGFVTYFSFLGSFFWLNVMSFDIWWSFRTFTGARRHAQSDRKKFLLYFTYGWGGPLIILIITLVMQFAENIDDDLRPKIGQGSCWITQKVLTVYLYVPMIILLIANILFFLLTALKIFKIQRETAVLVQTDNKRHNFDRENQRFKLYFKLFILMGVNWFLEILSYFVGGPSYYWYVTDVLNTLQGLIIFIMFVCKKKVFDLIVKKYNLLVEKYNLKCLGHKKNASENVSPSTTQTNSQSSTRDSMIEGTPNDKRSKLDETDVSECAM